MTGDPTVLVLGAGVAGLGTAGALRQRGVDVAVLEADDIGSSWRGRYDGLRLNTPGWMSGMPGYRATVRRYGEFPSRDEWVRYLGDYVEHQGLSVEPGVLARRVDPTPHGWLVETDHGPRTARAVVVATGSDRLPVLPPWPGVDSYRGELIHANRFRNASTYAGRDVLVVGPNVSGVEITTLLARAGARRVRLSVRTPPNLVTRKRFGLSVNITGIAMNRLPARAGDAIAFWLWRTKFGDLRPYGLPRSPSGVTTNMRTTRTAPAYDDGFVELLKAGTIEVVPAVSDLAAEGVALADGSVIDPDVVIAATGYGRGLEELVGHLGVIDQQGFPVVNAAGQHPGCPGLYFNGYRSDLSGMMRLSRIDARAIARHVARTLA